MQDHLHRAITEPVVLEPYDDSWPDRFIREKNRLMELCPGDFVAIEHFGSTAVPGMPAKPIVDILGGVTSIEVAERILEVLLLNGYTTSREFNAMLPDRKWLMRTSEGRRTHHLHIVEFGSPQWADRLAFRDVLRNSPEVARAYRELKQRLAEAHRDDREAYTAAKTEFVLSYLNP